GRPGSTMDIVRRGVGSLTQRNKHISVIDRFHIEDPDNNMISPSDIESVNVVKNASSISLYRASRSYGVIVIPTKRGTAGAPKINYQVNYGIKDPAKYMKLLNPLEFVKLQSELMGSQNPYLTDGKVLEDYRREKGVDWQGM